jgi:hypothetical protein
MLFTNIQLDNFQPTLARFIERLEIEGAEEREWIMMGVVTIASIMEYGRPGGVLRKLGCVGSKEVGGHGLQAACAIAMKVQVKKVAAGILESKTMLGEVNEESMDVDNMNSLSHHPSRTMDSVMKSPTMLDAEPQTSNGCENSNGDGIPHQPPAFKFALQLAFQMLSSEVLEMIEGKSLTDGTIEDDDGDNNGAHKSSGNGSEPLIQRWVRILRCGVNIAMDLIGWRGAGSGRLKANLRRRRRDGKRRIKRNWKRKRGVGWVGGGQKILWMLMMMPMRRMVRKRVRMMRMILKRSKL